MADWPFMPDELTLESQRPPWPWLTDEMWQGFVSGWNNCRKAMFANAPYPCQLDDEVSHG